MTTRITALMAWLKVCLVFLLAAATLVPGEAFAQRGGAVNPYIYRQPPVQQPVYRPPPPITQSYAYQQTFRSSPAIVYRPPVISVPINRSPVISGGLSTRPNPVGLPRPTVPQTNLNIYKLPAPTSPLKTTAAAPRTGSFNAAANTGTSRQYALAAAGVRTTSTVSMPKVSGNYAMPRVTTNLSSAKAAQLRARAANGNGGGNGKGGGGGGRDGSSLSAKFAKASANLRAAQSSSLKVSPSGVQQLSKGSYAAASAIAGKYTPGVSRLYRASDVPHFRTKWNGNNWADRGKSRVKHFKDHGHEFAAKSMREYSRMALQFRNKPPAGTLVRTGLRSGDWALYNSKSNTLMILTNKGQIKTFYKPGPMSPTNPRGWEGDFKSNLDYFERGLK